MFMQLLPNVTKITKLSHEGKHQGSRNLQPHHGRLGPSLVKRVSKQLQSIYSLLPEGAMVQQA